MNDKCECQSHMCNPGRDGHPRGGCRRDAVRMVTVRGEWVEVPFHANGGFHDRKRVPMCEPCATWHESKVTR